MSDENSNQAEQQAYAQAKKYGEELARLYAEEKTRRKELETTTQKLQAIFDTAPNALAVVDNDLTVVEANPRFQFLFEQTNDYIGRPLTDFLPAEPLQQTIQAIEAGSANFGSVEVEITAPMPRTLLVALAALSSGPGWVLIFHDLTERKRLEGLKDEFVNIAAHELRTPLGGVMGFVSVLRESLQEYNDPIVLHISDLILESTERLKSIIDELVDFATAQRNTQDGLHIVDINVNWLLQKSIKYLDKQIKDRDITCHIELPTPLLTIRGDQFILSEVIYQLLKNAVIFNKPGGQIIIRVQRLPLTGITPNVKDNNKEEATIIEIEDTGIGIPQTDLEKIFDKFYQIEEHLTRNVGGLGLGLTIARQGVEQHNGQLTVTSKLGQGSVFRMVLPPITRLKDVSIDNRPDVAHQQTLAYAKDMARAVAAQLKMKKKLAQIETLTTTLTQTLDLLQATVPGGLAYASTLSQMQNIARELLELSQQTGE
ncbi:MAG: PAS domain-containing protein [Anaerolineae bacterium]|nr:PAS domain-containing protein [Anaerolineae bacterium]